MKIIDVVSENIDEGILSGAARLAARALGAARLGRGGQIDNYVRRFITRNGTHATDAELLHSFPGENVNNIRREIERRASGRYGRRIRKNIRNQQMARDVEFINTTFANAIRNIRYTINLVALGELGNILFKPFKEYYDRMKIAEKWLNAPNPTERWNQEKYDAFHRQELVSLVDKIARVYVTNKILRMVPNIGNLFGTTAIGNAITTMSRPIRYWLADEIARRPDLANAFSLTMINHLFPMQGDKVPPVVENILGQGLANAENKIFGAIKQAEKSQGQTTSTSSTTTPAQPAATTPAQPAATTPAQPAATTPAQPAKAEQPTQAGQSKITPTQAALNKLKPIKPEDWKPFGADWVKHIPSDQIFRKDDIK